MSGVAERVAAGAAFLDEHDPDWWREDVDRAINLDTLDLNDTSYCILGQRCPLETLVAYVGTLRLGPEDDFQRYFAYGVQLSDGAGSLLYWAGRLGFASGEIGSEPGVYRELTVEWRRVIIKRRVVAASLRAAQS